MLHLYSIWYMLIVPVHETCFCDVLPPSWNVGHSGVFRTDYGWIEKTFLPLIIMHWNFIWVIKYMLIKISCSFPYSGRGAVGAAARCVRDSWRPGQRRAAAASHEFSWLGRPRGCDVVDANLAERAATSHQPALAFRLSFSGCVYSVTLNHIKILIIANDQH